MNFQVKKCLPFLTIFTIISLANCLQHSGNGQEGRHNELSNSGYDNKEEGKYPFQPYGFGYDIEDGYGNKQWRHEKGQQASNVMGSYGFKGTDGIMREVEYVADKNGFRARIKTNEPGTAPKDPGDVTFDAQPVMVSHQVGPSNHGDQGGQGGQGSQGGQGGQDQGRYAPQDYEGKSSAPRVQHRVGRMGRMRPAASAPRYAYLPYH